MSSYAKYCRDQAAECARRARLASSPDIAANSRTLELRWLKLAEKASTPGRPDLTLSVEQRHALVARGMTLFFGAPADHCAVLMTESSYLPEPMPVSAKMPWSAIHLKVSS
jgi:hypothetical protein